MKIKETPIEINENPTKIYGNHTRIKRNQKKVNESQAKINETRSKSRLILGILFFNDFMSQIFWLRAGAMAILWLIFRALLKLSPKIVFRALLKLALGQRTRPAVSGCLSKETLVLP